jgi:hypothetical protein
MRARHDAASNLVFFLLVFPIPPKGKVASGDAIEHVARFQIERTRCHSGCILSMKKRNSRIHNS